ncbi:MAG: cytidine deaminase, partial [Chloroflexi bacterium]|nr:cytidine deaminase [Chloroflexota bacterium]
KMIINAGIKHVVYGGAYPDDLGRQFLLEAGVSLTHFTPPAPGSPAG